MNHHLPQDIGSALADLSEPRLHSYRVFFSNPQDSELYGFYSWNDAISMRLMRLIGNIEIILRNRFHRELSKLAFSPGVSAGTAESNDWYRFVISAPSTAATLITKHTNGNLVSTRPCHYVVAKMTYGFWPRLLQISQTNTGTAIPWETMIPAMFPDHVKKLSSYWADQHAQDKLFMRLDLIGDLRNRVAHFEPVWKFKALKDEWIKRAGHPVTTASPMPSNHHEAIVRLRLVYTRTTQLLSWLSKSAAADYMASENHLNLDWLMSEDGFEHFKKMGNAETIELETLTESLGQRLELISKKSVLIAHQQHPIGRYFALG